MTTATHQPTPYIVAESVCKSFGAHQVLKDVSTTFHTGEVTVIIGASGSGKSTLLRAINRLEPHDSGRITIGGVEVCDDHSTLQRQRCEVGVLVPPAGFKIRGVAPFHQRRQRVSTVHPLSGFSGGSRVRRAKRSAGRTSLPEKLDLTDAAEGLQQGAGRKEGQLQAAVVEVRVEPEDEEKYAHADQRGDAQRRSPMRRQEPPEKETQRAGPAAERCD